MTIISIEQAGKHDGQEVTIRGWLYNLRESGKLLFPIFRDGTGIIQGVVRAERKSRSLRSAERSDAGIQRHRHRKNPRRAARARRLRNGRHQNSKSCRKFPKPSPIPSSSKSTASISCSTTAISGFARRARPRILRIRAEAHTRRPQLHGQPGLHAHRRADVHARGLRRHLHAFRSELHRRPKSLPHAKRPALHRSHRHGARQGLHLRPDLPRRKIEDPPPPHRILDARARSRLRRPRRHDGPRRRPGQRHRAVRARK